MLLQPLWRRYALTTMTWWEITLRLRSCLRVFNCRIKRLMFAPTIACYLRRMMKAWIVALYVVKSILESEQRKANPLKGTRVCALIGPHHLVIMVNRIHAGQSLLPCIIFHRGYVRNDSSCLLPCSFPVSRTQKATWTYTCNLSLRPLFNYGMRE